MECLVMMQGYRRGFTAAEKSELWDRWRRGESLKAIGRAFGKPSSSIYVQVAPHGGVRPSPRRRSRLALTVSEASMDKDRIKGSAKRAKGKVKEVAGKVLGDSKLKSEG